MTIRSMTVTEARSTSAKFCKRPYRLRTKLIITGILALVVVAAIVGYLITNENQTRREAPDAIEPLKPSASKLRFFQKAAVCTDSPLCSEIGRSILAKNGSAVDAAVAAIFCNGVMNMQSMGLGGGFFMVVYIKEEERAYSVNARETAPSNATEDMFHGNSEKASKGPLAVGIPGELRGMWAAHQRWGKLPWPTLIEPTLELCSGFVVSLPLYDGIMSTPYAVKNDPNLRKTFYNAETGQFVKPGTMVRPSEALCSTLRRIAEKGGDELYNGTLSVEFLNDLTRAGSIISSEDLRSYQPKISAPIAAAIGNGDILYTPPPPSSGVILVNILNTLSGYNFTETDISDTNRTILTSHRILEAFKYAYASRTKLGDADFLDLKELIANMTKNGEDTRLRINDTTTSNNTRAYGAVEYNPPDSGTAHISIIAANGDAVSVTSSVNYYFGAGFTTLKTGIIMNNVMDDFSSPGVTNYFGLKPSPANSIVPGKRPLSSMSPSIIVDSGGNAKMVIGASGGTKITTAVALVAMRKLWFGQDIKQAVDAARIHHQIFPMTAEYEFGVTQDVLQGLRAKGHGLVRYRGRGSVVCALFRNSTGIFANADFRKDGDVSGMDE